MHRLKMSSQELIESLSPKAARLLGLPVHQALDTTVIGHRIPIRSIMREDLEYRSRGAETTLLYKDDKPVLQAGIPYEQQSSGSSHISKAASKLFDDKSPIPRCQEGFFTSMAKQQRKNAFVNLTSFRVAKKTPNTSGQSQRGSHQKLGPRRSQRSLRATPQTQLPRIVTASIPVPQPHWTHLSPPPALTRVSSNQISETSPAPSLMTDSDSRSRSSSGSGSPVSIKSESPKPSRSRRIRNADFTHSKDLSSYFGFPASRDLVIPRRKASEEPSQINSRVESLSLSDEYAQYPTPYSHSIFSEYLTSSSGEQSIELTALGDNFEMGSQDPSNFRAFFLPTPVRNYFELDAAETSRERKSSTPTHGSASSQGFDRTRDIIIDGTSVLDLSFDDEDEENVDYALFQADENAGRVERLGQAYSIDPGMEYIHPLLREALIADQATDSEDLMRNPSLDLNRARRNSGFSTTSTVYDPEPKSITKSASDFENNKVDRVANENMPKAKSERFIAVSEEEEKILAMMRHQRASAQQSQGYSQPIIPIELEHRRSKSEEQIYSRHKYQCNIDAQRLRRRRSQNDLKTNLHSKPLTKPPTTFSAISRTSSKSPSTPETIEAALNFDSLGQASGNSRPVNSRSTKSQESRDDLNKPLPTTPIFSKADSVISSTSSTNRPSTPPLPTKSPRRTTSCATRGTPGQWQPTAQRDSPMIPPLSTRTIRDRGGFFSPLPCKPDVESDGEVRIASLTSIMGGPEILGWDDTWI